MKQPPDRHVNYPMAQSSCARSCPYRGGSGWRSQVTPNDKQVGVGACHSLDPPFAWTTLDLADSQKFTDPNPPQDLAETLHQT